jgi:tRNA-Thr(GGU) m(6)t(6)A37 methyltransferase TsaA
MEEIKFKAIGRIRSPFKVPRGTPIQPGTAKGTLGTVEVFPEYVKGLKDLDGFSHVILIYHFHLVQKSSLEVIPFMDDQVHGVFSTRAPNRPNPIGISVVRLLKKEGHMLHVKDLDIVDGTPLLDIKPYVPEFDGAEVKQSGWLEKNLGKLPDREDDGRFTE